MIKVPALRTPAMVGLGYILGVIIPSALLLSYLLQVAKPLGLFQEKVREPLPWVIVGPYPIERDLRRLRDVRGVEEVISLLDPPLPFEALLIAEEEKAAVRLGLKFRKEPFSYINLKNPDTQERLFRLAEEVYQRGPRVKVYVHCYLGRHRTKAFEEALLTVAKRR
ncbi:MAG: hypothetical protein ACK4ZX_09245 [Thermus sp.]